MYEERGFEVYHQTEQDYKQVQTQYGETLTA
jgi:hypothetical protein